MGSGEDWGAAVDCCCGCSFLRARDRADMVEGQGWSYRRSWRGRGGRYGEVGVGELSGTNGDWEEAWMEIGVR